MLSKPSRLVLKRKPSYIINHDNKCLALLKTLLYITTLPNICLNLFLVAFVYKPSESIVYAVCVYMDALYAIEILTAFFTSYLD